MSNNQLKLRQPITNGGIRVTNFFNGRLVTGADLTREQSARREADKRIGRAAGAGIVNGLEVMKSPASSAIEPVVIVSGGLAINRRGQSLFLEQQTELALSQQSQAISGVGSTIFSDCQPVTGSTQAVNQGIYLLVLSPAETSEGRAPTSGLHNYNSSCDIDALVEAVQFRLLAVDPYLTSDALQTAERLQNYLAYRCFGTANNALFWQDPLSLSLEKYGLVDEMRGTALSDCDVPLAIVDWTSQGLKFVDMWSVRRRSIAHSDSTDWPQLIGERRRRESEAMIEQFAAQIKRLQTEETALQQIKAADHFRYLPPVGLLPLANSGRSLGFNAENFFGAKGSSEITLLDGDLLQMLLDEALVQEPIDLNTDDIVQLYYLRENVKAVEQRPNVQSVLVFARHTLPYVVSNGKRGTCTLTAAPGANWQKVFEKIPENGDAQICLTAGEFLLDEPVTIKDKRFIKLAGAGNATRIIVRGQESTLIFEACASVLVTDISVEASQTREGDSDNEGLNGTLMFRDCSIVDVERVTASCGHGAIRAASCIYVINRQPEFPNLTAGKGLVRVRQCRLLPGHGQIGVLVVNGSRTQIEDNIVQRREGLKPKELSLKAVQKNKSLRGEVRRVLVSDLQEGATSRRKIRVEMTFGDLKVNFLTHPDMFQMKFWENMKKQFPPKNINSVSEAFEYVRDVADSVLENPKLNEEFARWFDKVVVSEDKSALYQGIVIAGQDVDEIRVLNNTVLDAAEGIHIGFSPQKRGDKKGKIGTVSGNTVSSLRPPTVTRQAHGIYTSGCENLLMTNNILTLQQSNSTKHLDTNGIEVTGEFGKRMLVRENSAEGYATGILVDPKNSVIPALWRVTENLATVKAPNQVVELNNVNP